jgi:hypothetical protein
VSPQDMEALEQKLADLESKIQKYEDLVENRVYEEWPDPMKRMFESTREMLARIELLRREKVEIQTEKVLLLQQQILSSEFQ